MYFRGSDNRIPEKLDVKQENEKNEDDSKILVSVMGRMDCLQLS